MWYCRAGEPTPPASTHNGNAISKDHGSALATENTITFMTKHIIRAMRMTRRPSPRHEIITGNMKLPAILRTPSKTYLNPMVPVPYPATSRKRSPISVKYRCHRQAQNPLRSEHPRSPVQARGLRLRDNDYRMRLWFDHECQRRKRHSCKAKRDKGHRPGEQRGQ